MRFLAARRAVVFGAVVSDRAGGGFGCVGGLPRMEFAGKGQDEKQK